MTTKKPLIVYSIKYFYNANSNLQHLLVSETTDEDFFDLTEAITAYNRHVHNLYEWIFPKIRNDLSECINIDPHDFFNIDLMKYEYPDVFTDDWDTSETLMTLTYNRSDILNLTHSHSMENAAVFVNPHEDYTQDDLEQYLENIYFFADNCYECGHKDMLKQLLVQDYMLSNYTDHSDDEIREQVARTAQTYDRRDILIDMATDPDPIVRKTVIEAAKDLKDADILVEILKYEYENATTPDTSLQETIINTLKEWNQTPN